MQLGCPGILRDPGEHVAHHAIVAPIDVARCLYDWNTVLDRLRAVDPNCNVEYRLCLQAWDCRAPDVFDLAGHSLESIREAGTLFDRGPLPHLRMMH